MDFTHTNEVSTKGLDVMAEMVGQEGDVDVLPFEGLQ